MVRLLRIAFANRAAGVTLTIDPMKAPATAAQSERDFH
jgi:hypothetical protein